MNRTAAIALAVVMAASLAAAQAVSARDRTPQTKSVTGQVTNSAGQPLANAVVYLKDMKTLTVKTFIADKDGGYHVHGLSPNVDYDLYAESDGARSDNKTISQFDSKSNLTIHLKIKK